MHIFQGINSLNDIVKRVKEYQNQLLIVLAIVSLLSSGIFGFFYYKRVKEERAYSALVSALEYFDAPIITEEKKEEDLSFLDRKEFKSNQEKWEKVETVFKNAYTSHSGAGIASMFLAYQVEALLQLGKLDEAIDVLQQVIAKSSSEEANEFYRVKLALMQIDTTDATKGEVGLSSLKSIAADERSVAHDTALYHLGLLYWYKKDFKEAKNYWNQLVLKYGKQEKYPSPWIEVAKEKLRLIDRDVE